jgi:hypothetical protein
MKNKINDAIQWFGALFVIGGHSLNAMGPEVYPYNIVVFMIGTSSFLLWSLRVANKPQLLVNVIALGIGVSGLIKAFG